MVEMTCVIIQSNNSEFFKNVIVRMEMMRGCMIISTEYTPMSVAINN